MAEPFNFELILMDFLKYMPEAKCRTTRWILPEIEKVVLEAFKAQLLFLSDVPKKKRESGRPAAA